MPLHPRLRDLGLLELLAEELGAWDNPMAPPYQAALRRLLADAYPKRRRSQSERDFWIACDYRLRVDHRREKSEAAAKAISNTALRRNIPLSPERVKAIASETAKRQAARLAEQVAYLAGEYVGDFSPEYGSRIAQMSAETSWILAHKSEAQEQRLRKRAAPVRK
jgi:hypothetical protein